MGGSGELSLGSIRHRSQWCCGASLPSALCSRCSHVCETMEKKVINGFFCFEEKQRILLCNVLDVTFVIFSQSGEGEIDQNKETGYDNPNQDETFRCGSNENCHAFQGDECEVFQCIKTTTDENKLGDTECSNSNEPEIHLILRNVVTAADHVMMPLETGDVLSAEGNSDAYELEGEWCPENHCDVTNSSGNVLDEEPMPELEVADLWDWEKVTGTRRDGKGEVVRLVGRLVRRSVKCHPSTPLGGGLLKSAPICEVHLDLVRVMSGQVYKLRTPNGRYIAPLSTYDSSNPRKGWGFPELSVDRHPLPFSKSSGNHVSKTADGVPTIEDLSTLPDNLSASGQRIHVYRDRAAERRTLHGGFGVGPRQKISKFGEDERSSSYASANTEEAAAEALKMSFGAGSYARKLMESMGWKEVCSNL
ncbi:hypothetical protein CMV_007521 [Castanea mollissima]|uniref:G-patch domain-containing protein n=1 Tax=Castanea mollissima TaxID=60419 RepID=A0A8J4RUW9_9ROSI|nr:hypothetical protein CMV_007521 [Castanea mollissima]